MKHCRKSQKEPDCLSDFRRSQPGASWDEFRSEGRSCYESLRNVVLADQAGLCGYCELKLDEDNRQIAHFHPKSDQETDTHWALAWDNLWLACKGGTQKYHSNPAYFRNPILKNISCDECKGNRVVDGLVLSPGDIPLFPRIFKFDPGEGKVDIVPDEDGCSQAGIQVAKVRQTITIFNLNCDRLAEARWGHYLGIKETLVNFGNLTGDVYIERRKLLAKLYLSKDENGCWPSFFTLTRWLLKESAEDYLRSVAYQG